MKILSLVLILAFCLITSFVFADVTAEIIGKDIDNNGNIRIKTQYKINDVEVPSNYPKEDGKYYWVTRYSIQNFAGMTKLQIAERIKQDLKAFGEQLITKPFIEEQRILLKNANQEFFNSTNLNNIVGQKLTVTNATLIIDKNFDGIMDTELTCKTDGTKTETPYTAPIPIQ